MALTLVGQKAGQQQAGQLAVSRQSVGQPAKHVLRNEIVYASRARRGQARGQNQKNHGFSFVFL